MAAQTESPFYNPDVFREVYGNLGEVFEVRLPYLAWIPTYPSALWSFAFCSDTLDPLDHLDGERVAGKGIASRWYNADVHRASFALPNLVRELL